MMDKGKGLDKRIRVGDEAVSFLEFEFDDFRHPRDVEVIVDRVVGYINGSVEAWYKFYCMGNSEFVEWLG